MFPANKNLVKPDDWIFVQDSAPSHRSILLQDFLEKTFECCLCRMASIFIWCESIILFLLGSCKNEGISRQCWKAISSEQELKTKINAVWKGCATDLKTLRKAIKQFVSRLRTVEGKQGYCIKMIFGWLENL